jgi:outer membrane receptor for ferrienterochelin and colicin
MNRKKNLLFLFLFFNILSAYSQELSDSLSFYNMTLEELMDIKISVASKTELSVRESPSVVSVISAEEITSMGARDLMDVLGMVPGFNFGMDVFGVVGMSARGLWSHEGKVLLLLDGQEFNDLTYLNTQFGQRFDVTQIERVEIIRGPGSSVYGGSAALGVVNIITKSGKTLQGIEATSTYGFLNDTYARRNLSLSVGNANKEISYSLSGYIGQGRRSNSDYTDINGVKTNLKNSTELFPGMVNGSFQWKKLSARVIYDGYAVESPVGYTDIQEKPEVSSFKGLYSELKYEWNLSEKLTVIPKLNYRTTTPWALERDSPNGFYEVVASRLAPSLNVTYSTTNVDVVAGLDSFFDRGKQNNGVASYNFPNGTNQISYSNIGVFTQVHFKNNILPVFLGARVDNHSQYGAAFSPRVGVTKVFEKWNFKVLYSRAFRAPALENLRRNPKLTPELTGVAEVQIGYELSDKMSVTANAFDNQVKDPIVYYFNDEFPEGAYINYKSTSTRGLEVEYKYKGAKGFVSANYAFYTAAGNNQVDIYSVPNNRNQLLAFPQSRINLYGSFKITSSLSVNPSAILMSKRYGYSAIDSNNNLVLNQYGRAFYFNLFLHYKNIVKGLDTSFGIHDITDQKQLFIQPYNSGLVPIPGVGREFMIRVNYKFGF